MDGAVALKNRKRGTADAAPRFRFLEGRWCSRVEFSGETSAFVRHPHHTCLRCIRVTAQHV